MSVSSDWPDSKRVRRAFRDSAEWFANVVDDIGQEQWANPGLADWSVRELVGHCGINCTLILNLLDQTGTSPGLLGPTKFWQVVLAGSRAETHAGIAANASVAAGELGSDPAEAIRARIIETLATVDASADLVPMRFAKNELALIDFLPSRIVEFVAHGLDLCRAIGRDPSDIPVDAARLSAGWLGQFGDPVAVVEVLLGRCGSPYNVFE